MRDSGLRKQNVLFLPGGKQNTASCIQSAFHSKPNRSENTLIDNLRGKFLGDFNPVKLPARLIVMHPV